MSRGSLILYTTSACHLCEQALILLQPWLQQGWSVEEIDITRSEDLFQRYGLIIPVLRRKDCDRELNWPFDAALLAVFLGATAILD